MKELPKSTKILIVLIIGIVIILGFNALRSTKMVSDSVSENELVRLGVKEPKTVLNQYQKLLKEDETKAQEYIQSTIIEDRATLSLKEMELFEGLLVDKWESTEESSETTMYITYDKTEVKEDEFNILKSYMNHKNAYPVKIIYSTIDENYQFGQFLYGGYSDKEVKEYSHYVLPKAFLIIDGKKVKEYSDYKDLETNT